MPGSIRGVEDYKNCVTAIYAQVAPGKSVPDLDKHADTVRDIVRSNDPGAQDQLIRNLAATLSTRFMMSSDYTPALAKVLTPELVRAEISDRFVLNTNFV